ncbi:hypothetical protein EYC84_009146 [Monilinia fructicola]|uniref:Uncharacterized protein n=1 Tax=Monilinia fructicola TaxID=38448 RepID=A0A5M9JDB0_MONFR|nr:hypothetical protein EYC84_009146 [Monilinia fructicola]
MRIEGGCEDVVTCTVFFFSRGSPAGCLDLDAWWAFKPYENYKKRNEAKRNVKMEWERSRKRDGLFITIFPPSLGVSCRVG